ncbi:hypothetical protein BD779DRAFT_107250 [Infundibulicybe gibba]|nr:hypothetical protein BD779DRAFT_107250 [Infundibulicybe gibba]
MWWAKTFAPFLAFILLIQFSNSILINQTIDDGLGDLQTGLKVQYLPLMDDSGPVWKSHDTCGDTCFINPDSTRAHDNTWNSATCSGSDTVTATLSFRGTAIYIYFIVASIPRPDETIGADCDFWVDERFVGSYIQPPPWVCSNTTLWSMQTTA